MYQIADHLALCDNYRGIGYRKTPNLKVVYKISNKTKLVPLKTRHRYLLSQVLLIVNTNLSC